ncbi:hypothetical protein [Streptomyces rhizosphaerihabitans]|uniref:hypothetical protein n=1 Tax=Streptomyces rhizosphaerihabitans TaxID=1266770 RepID=UPI0021BF89A6|nr:hypothetical protein [Streptomyces rhizosphaerihabitans]MCT9010595.1 hypothetical protein [Streptomyces rhizosphaerihabitans]
MPPPIRKLMGRIGAVVEDVDLTAPQPLILRNRITQHYEVDHYDDHPRRLGHVKVAADVPVGVDGRRSEQLVGDASHYSKVLEVAAR